MNPIISRPKEKTISYEDIIHAPLWVLGDIKKKIKDPIEELIKILKESKDTIFCIQTPRLTHGELIQALQKAASQNVRIYLLVNEYTPELQSLRGEVLIRQGVTLKNSFVLQAPKTPKEKGYFFTSSLTQAYNPTEQFSSSIESHQIKELFTHFCYYFWQKATHELLESDTPTPIQERPIQIPYNPNSHQRKDFVLSHLFIYFEAIHRKKLKGKYILYLGKEEQAPILITETNKINLGNYTFDSLPSYEKFEKQAPEFEDNNTALFILYRWVNIPFSLPYGAEEHPLYKQWREKEQELRKKTNDKLTENKKVLDTCNRNKELYENIRRLFLSKNKKLEDNEEMISLLLDEPLFLQKDIASHIKEINQILNDIEKDIQEIENSISIEKHRKTIESYKEEITQKKKDETTIEEHIKSIDNDKERKKTEKELSEVKSRIKYLEKEIEKEQNKINKIDTCDKKEEGSLLNLIVNDKNIEKSKKEEVFFTVPTIKRLPDPSYCKLWTFEGKNYLSITDWDHYQYAAEYADREKELNVIICASTKEN